MYLHLGENVVVSGKRVVALIDLENATVSAATKDFLKVAQRKGRVVTVTDEMPKSAVVCESGGDCVVYISQISTSTLQKRAEKMEVAAKWQIG